MTYYLISISSHDREVTISYYLLANNKFNIYMAHSGDEHKHNCRVFVELVNKKRFINNNSYIIFLTCFFLAMTF